MLFAIIWKVFTFGVHLTILMPFQRIAHIYKDLYSQGNLIQYVTAEAYGVRVLACLPKLMLQASTISKLFKSNLVQTKGW